MAAIGMILGLGENPLDILNGTPNPFPGWVLVQIPKTVP